MKKRNNEKKVRLIAGAFLLLIVLGIAVVSATDEKIVKQDANMETKEKSPEFKKFVVDLALIANSFRLSSASNINKAISKNCVETCVTKWKNHIQPHFKGQETQWHDFFSNAILLFGRADQGKAVVAFYNPWVDGLFFTHWQIQEKNLKIVDFLVVTGESWRKEALDPNGLPLPQWQQSNKTVPLALEGPYTKTVELFNSEYPLDGTFMFLTSRLKDFGLEEKQEQEISTLKNRMALRMEMFLQFLKAESDSDIGLVRKIAVISRKLIREGKREELQSLIKGRQNPVMIDGLFNAADSIRNRLSYNCMMLKGQRGIVTLVNPVYPQWFVVLYVNVGMDQKETSLDSFEMYKFEFLKHLLSAPEVKGNK